MKKTKTVLVCAIFCIILGLPLITFFVDLSVPSKETREVDDKIAAIGEVTIESESELYQLKEEVNDLSSAQKKFLTNEDKLDDALEKLEKLKKERAEKVREINRQKGNELLKEMQLKKDDVKNIKFYRPEAIPCDWQGNRQPNVRSFVLPYIGIRDENVWLRLLYNYTGEDWVFFEKVIFAIDDERYTKNFDFTDITRDNSGRKVWEFVDTEVTDSDQKLLWDIVKSTKTIIRFQGDDYHHDIIVSEEDKTAIENVLTAYSYLK